MGKKHLGVEVTIFDSSDEQIRQRRGNYIDETFRVWINRTIGWALNQSYEVEIRKIPETSNES